MYGLNFVARGFTERNCLFELARWQSQEPCVLARHRVRDAHDDSVAVSVKRTSNTSQRLPVLHLLGYASPDQVTAPRGVITDFMGFPALVNGVIVPFGNYTFTRLD